MLYNIGSFSKSICTSLICPKHSNVVFQSDTCISDVEWIYFSKIIFSKICRLLVFCFLWILRKFQLLNVLLFFIYCTQGAYWFHKYFWYMYSGCLGPVILKYSEVTHNTKRDGVRRTPVKFATSKIEVSCYIKSVFCHGLLSVDTKWLIENMMMHFYIPIILQSGVKMIQNTLNDSTIKLIWSR